MSRRVLAPAQSRFSTLTMGLVLAIVLAGTWAFSNSVAGVLVLDDVGAITWNPSIRSLSPISSAMSPPPGTTVSGRPVANLSFAVNYALAPADVRDVFAPASGAGSPETTERFLRNVWGYHVMNLVIHLLSGVVLFGVIRRTLRNAGPEDPAYDRATWLAFVITLIWIVHPIQTQSVTYLVQRVESLVGLFYLLTMYCAIRAIDRPASTAAARWWTAGAVVACALGMATKESMVTAPVMVMVWAWMFRAPGAAEGPKAKGSRPRAANPTLLFVLLAATWLILVPIVLSSPRGKTAGFGNGWTAWSYLLTQAGVIVHYLQVSLAPVSLVFSYAWPKAESVSSIAPQAALVLAVLVVTIVGVVRRKPLAFAGAWFFGILAPTSSVVPVVTEIAADHRLYLPLAGVLAVVVVGAYIVGSRLFAGRARPGIALGAVLSCAVVLTFGTMTRARNLDFSSDERIWLDTVQKQPNNPRAQLGYGMDLIVAGRYSEAESHLRIAASLEENPVTLSSLGAALLGQNKLDDAVAYLERSLALWPDGVDAHRNLGQIYFARRQDALALPHLSRALERQPNDQVLLTDVAWILSTSPDDALRNGSKAVELAERAVRVNGGKDVRPFETLAAAYAEVDRFDDAASAIRLAMAVARQPAIVSALQDRLAHYQAHKK